MSQYLGRNKNKSKVREITRQKEKEKSWNNSSTKKVMDSLGMTKDIVEKPKCYHCGRPAYKSDSHNYICEKRAYSGNCTPESESIENRILNNNNK